MYRILSAGILIALLLAAHAFLHTQLISIVIAPFVLAVWISFLPEPSEWLLFLLILTAELLSNAPPGAMALAILLPLLVRSILSGVSVRLSVRFLMLMIAMSTAQISVLIIFIMFSLDTYNLPWSHAALATIGTGFAAFLINIIWHEFIASYERV